MENNLFGEGKWVLFPNGIKTVKKVLVVAKEYPEYYGKEMYVIWIRNYDKGTWYHLSFDPNEKFPTLYLGEKQIKHIQ